MNSRPLVPQTSALTGLRYAPNGGDYSGWMSTVQPMGRGGCAPLAGRVISGALDRAIHTLQRRTPAPGMQAISEITARRRRLNFELPAPHVCNARRHGSGAGERRRAPSSARSLSSDAVPSGIFHDAPRHPHLLLMHLFVVEVDLQRPAGALR